MAHGGRSVKPSCPLTGDRTESKMSFTLQSSLWDQAIIELGLKSHPCLATTSSLLSHSLTVSFSWKHLTNKSHAHEPLSQGLTLGELDPGQKRYSYTAPTLKELSG